MSFLIYFAVALVTLFGVLFEMNILVEPPRKIEHAVAAPARQAQPAAQVRIGAPATDASAESDAAVNRPTMAPPSPVTASSNKCDVTVCAATYHSFRAADCTYQPDEGPRRLCDKGVPSDPATAAAVLNSHADASVGAQSSAKCNVGACTAAYVSFTPADCTYQPLEGPRRLCAK
jgi:hypothetical protein